MPDRSEGRDDVEEAGPVDRTRAPRITVGLAYYSPYVSGLSEVARRLCEEMARRGWEVHVVTTRHDPGLARHAVVGGVGIRRCRTLMGLGRAPVSPSFPISLIRSARQSDVTLLHLPLPEAGLVSLFVPRSRLFTFYHCDPATLQVPGESLFRRLIDLSSRIAVRRSHTAISTSEDYARSSRLSRDLLRRNAVIPPPCIERPLGEPSFRETPGLHVGFLGRIVEEKGLEHLVAAFRRLEDPDARLLVAGEFDELAGGSVIRSVSRVAAGDPRIRFLGYLPEESIPDFYASLDVFVLPSVDSFEAFGIVQVEALLAGVPVITTDLPGVRTVAPSLGAGTVVPRRDARALEQALREAEHTTVDRAAIRDSALEAYGVDSVTTRLEAVLGPAELVSRARRARRARPTPACNSLFDDDPEKYAELREGWLFERRVRHVVDFLAAARPGDVVLEIGPGTGGLLERLAAARPDLRFRGVEPIGSYVKYASDRWTDHDPEHLRMLHGFAEDLDELDLEPADWVLSNDVLHHVLDFTRTAAAVAAVAKPWAQWLAIEPNPQNPWVVWYHTRTPGEQVFRERRFLAAAAATGWELCGREHLFLVPQALKRPPRSLVTLERVFERLPVISGGTALRLSRTAIE